ELVVALAGALAIPLRDRNALLAAAGFASIYRASAFDADELGQLRRALDHVLRQQEPYGAIVDDRQWNVLRLKPRAARLFREFPATTPDGLDAARNVLLGTVHPGALRPYIVNWEEAAGHLVARLHHEVAARPGDDELRRLLTRILAQPDVPTQWRVPSPGRSAPPFLPIHLKSPSLELRLFTIVTSIGTPLDVTAQDLHVQTSFP